MEKILILDSINKKINNKVILQDINLIVNKTEKIAIMGANGAGKSTLCEIIAKIIKPNSGKIKYFFTNNIKNPKLEIGIQLQIRDWPGLLTIKQILEFYQNIYDKKISSNNIKNLLLQFDLHDFIKMSVQKLSPGQRQRFNLLLAFIHQPELIILDEPGNDLDVFFQYKIYQYLFSVIKPSNQTLLIVSHNVSEIIKICNRVIFIKDKKIYADFFITNSNDSFKKINKLF